MHTPTLLLFSLLQETAARAQVEKPSALREIILPAARAQAEVQILHANEEKQNSGLTIPAIFHCQNRRPISSHRLLTVEVSATH